MFVERLKQK